MSSRSDNFNKEEKSDDKSDQSPDRPFKMTMNPLEIECILDLVLNYLKVDDLKTSRLVSTLWNDEASKKLYKKCFISVPSSIYSLPESDDESEKNTDKQNKELSQSKAKDDSPAQLFTLNKRKISRIIIRDPRDISTFSLLSLLSPQIKQLKYYLTRPKMLATVLALLPNLEYLNTGTDFCDVTTEVDRDLITICNDLTTRGINKADAFVISHLVLYAYYHTKDLDISPYEKFADGKVKVENLLFSFINPIFDIPPSRQRLIQVLNKIIWKSQQVLKSLCLYDCETFLHGLKLPPLLLLTYIKLTFYIRPEQLEELKFGFPPGFKFANQLPNLKDMELTVDGDLWSLDNDSTVLNKIFENTGVAKSLRNLTYSSLTGSFNLDNMFQNFRFLENLELNYLRCNYFKTVSQSIWKFLRKLKTLRFYIGSSDFSQLDGLFTGFSMETVEDLRQKLWTMEDAPDVEGLRVNPSIMDLPCLVKMVIETNQYLDHYRKQRFLAVAERFAFHLLPKLEVWILTESRNARGRACFHSVLLKASQD